MNEEEMIAFGMHVRNAEWRLKIIRQHGGVPFPDNIDFGILAAAAELTRLREAVEWSDRIRGGIDFSVIKEVYSKQEVSEILLELRRRAKEG